MTARDLSFQYPSWAYGRGVDALIAVANSLARAVDDGRLVGFVCGVREAGASHIVAGGSHELGGPRLAEDAVFALSSTTKPLGGLLATALVERGALELDAPVDTYLPELGALRVLSRPDGPLDDTVPADRRITLRHLLSMTAGFGWVGQNPALTEAMSERGVGPGPYAPSIDPDTYLQRLAELPLATHPGEGWWYHTSSDVLGVLLARATRSSVAVLMEEHVTGPLGLTDTAFVVDPARLPTSYGAGPDGELQPLPIAERFAQSPVFESLACGLASTVADYLTFLASLVDGGPVLTEAGARLLATDQLTDSQRAAAQDMLGPGCGFGFQVEVRPDGAVGWAGGLGSIGYVDRRTGRSAAVFTTQSFEVPGTQEALDEVWSLLKR